MNPTPLTGYLPNPGMGWQEKVSPTKPRFDYWVEYPIRAEVAWDILNPAPGVYDWNVLDTRIKSAASRGRKFSFKIYNMASPDDPPRVPAWVFDAGAHQLSNGDVDWSDAVFQEHWETFVNALRLRYDGDPRIAWIEISGYGFYNEWSWNGQTKLDDDFMAPTTIDGTTRKRLADMFIGGSGTVLATRSGDDANPLEISYSYPGFRQTQLLMPHAGIRQSTWYVMTARPDAGFRFACLGRETLSYMRSRLGESVMQTWRRAPVVFEFCSHDVSMERARELAAGMGASVIRDNRQSSNPELESVIELAGYRFVLESLTTMTAARTGEALRVEMTWTNSGSAPAYRSLGQDFVLRAALVSANGGIAHRWTLDADVMSWAPGSTNAVNSSLEIPPDLPGGRYDLAVGIYDRDSGAYLNLGIVGTRRAGWYPLTVVEVRP